MDTTKKLAEIALQRKMFKEKTKTSDSLNKRTKYYDSLPQNDKLVDAKFNLLKLVESDPIGVEPNPLVTIKSNCKTIVLPEPIHRWEDPRLPEAFSHYHAKFGHTIGNPTLIQSYLWAFMLRGLDCLAVVRLRVGIITNCSPKSDIESYWIW